LFLLFQTEKPDYVNPYQSRDFRWVHNLYPNSTFERLIPLRDARPDRGEVNNPEGLFRLIKEMIAINNTTNIKMTNSGDYVTGQDRFDKRCAFSQIGGGSVTDLKLLYMLCM
jgi:hypothetical protein